MGSIHRIFVSVLLGCSLTVPALAADLEAIGSFDFPSSANAQAQPHFLRGVGFLHSFGTTQALAEFQRAQELDPDFALAYWGEAFSYQHPFFGGDSERPGEALRRLGPTPEARLALAANDKERGFLKAAEAYALTPGGMAERRHAWWEAMTELYEKYPDDDEVKAFYVVSMLATSYSNPDPAVRERMNMQAGALALELFKKNDNHPGAAHYVIHAFDDPVHAPIALEAALKYADIAPAVSHARHMPTHIFIQHGMWNEVAMWNESAFNVARELWQAGDPAGEQNHSSDWGQYGDLQRGDIERSRLWIRRAEQTLRENPDDGRSRGTLNTVIARHTIETQQWELQELSDELGADELLALGLSAAHLGELELAEQVAARLHDMASSGRGNTTVQIMHNQVAALSKAMQAQELLDIGLTTDGLPQQQQALDLLTEAVALKEQQPPPNGAATPLKPIHELTGEVMLSFGLAQQAAAMFETSLLRLPNRPWSLLGAARSYAASNQKEKAAQKYQALLAVWSDDSRPAVQEAKRYLGY
ncbi:MAG: hypothetical protein RL120_17065 [Gammaproteobacteria bacterium]